MPALYAHFIPPPSTTSPVFIVFLSLYFDGCQNELMDIILYLLQIIQHQYKQICRCFCFAGWKYGKKGLSAVKFNRSFCST